MQPIIRNAESPENPRGALVQKLLDEVRADLKHWDPDFKRMKANRKFARGLQWPGMKREDLHDPDRLYTENVTLRHLKQRVASIYARNPQFVWRRSKRLYHKVWDGTAEMLVAAQQALAPNPMTGLPGAPNPLAAMVLQEASDYAEQSRLVERTGETLAILYSHAMREQTQPMKHMMKRVVMTAATCGVGYVKQSFQRTMAPSPETERAINDAKSQIERATRIQQDLADGEIEADDAEVERLTQLITELENAEKILLREGLALDFPDPMNIIPARGLEFLPTFLGCTHVTERYFLSPDRVKEVYGVDLGDKFTPYRPETGIQGAYTTAGDREVAPCVCVYEMHHKADGLVYVMAEGYPDFLRDPEPPFPWTERFWPWFPYAPNWLSDPENPFPPSDVELIDTMQMEINRAGEGLRQHRWAARPGHAKSGQLAPEDKRRIEERLPHEVVPLAGMGPDQKIADILQPFPTSPIDQNLYDTSPAMQGILRAAGTQEANIGPTSGATATEASIAQSSRASSDDSAIDELDDLLTEMARAGGQILLLNLTSETVFKIAGPGAVWPEQSMEDIAQEIYLEVEAGSSGRKNQAHEIQTWTQMFPLMAQVPGYNQERMARGLLAVMDARMQPEDWLEKGAPSLTALNGQMQASANNGTAADPMAQGPAGARNAPTPEPGGAPGPKAPSPDRTQSAD